MVTKLIRGLNNIPKTSQGRVVTIGNFDGVHLGHQALLARLKEKAIELQLPSLVITFEPQPFEFFAGEKCVARLTRCREKFCWLAEYGVDEVLIVNFNKQFAAITAEQFVAKILHQSLHAKHVIVGDDFRFGHKRMGDFKFLQATGAQHGFAVESMPSVMFDHERISSTRIRNALVSANHTLAEELLGRPYTMTGRVVHGDKRGRVMGFPTANIFLHRKVSPVQGIYIVRMHGLAKTPLPGVANVGTRPTMGGTRTLLEVHLFDFAKEIYGRHVSVEFCEKLREEERFDSIDLLVEQMWKDAAAARQYFKKRGEL